MNERYTTQQLLVRRRVTRALAEHLTTELDAHLHTLAPLLAPRGVFGPHVRGGGTAQTKGADEALKQLSAEYEAIHRSKPFSLRSRFETPVEIMAAAPALTPVEYEHSIAADTEGRQIRVTSPFRWVLGYRGFGSRELRSLVGHSGSAADSQLQQCVLHHIALFVVLSRRDGLQRLLASLRFPVTFERKEEFGRLPLVVVSCPLSTFLPPDEVVLESTELSGTPQFEEVIDLDAVKTLADPFKDKVIAVLKDQGDAEVQERMSG